MTRREKMIYREFTVSTKLQGEEPHLQPLR